MPYSYFLSLTSQFPICSIPLRLDSFSRCSYRCCYCFAHERGGNHPPRGVSVADPGDLRNYLRRSIEDPSERDGVVVNMLRRRVPIHFGGMSDPFMLWEMKTGTTLEMLKILREFAYPTIISTKGIIPQGERYFNLLTEMNCIMQFSFCSYDQRITAALEHNTPTPDARLRVIKSLSEHLPVTARLQPLIPTLREDAIELIDALSEAGARHVGVEHLKVGLSNHERLFARIEEGVGQRVSLHYSQRRRRATEYLVNCDYLLETHSILAKQARRRGIEYAAADTELLPYSDSDCCCSGAEQFAGFGNYLRHTWTHAAKRAINAGKRTIEYSSIESEWVPKGSINRFINSRVRIKGRSELKDYMGALWKMKGRLNTPALFYGVSEGSGTDEPRYVLDTTIAAAVKEILCRQ